MIDKEIVKTNFSRAADSYEDYAVVQDYMGQVLADMIDDKTNSQTILELGAGTGLFTEKLLAKLPETSYLLVDLAPSMIEQCQNKFSAYDNIDYLVADAEQSNWEGEYDLIVANATVQWFKNLEKTIKKFKEHLKEDGSIYFSTFGQDNFKEFAECCNGVLEGGFAQNFKSKRELISLVASEFRAINIKEEEYVEKFTTVREFLRATKKIGANSAKENKPQLPPNKLRQLENLYREKYSVDGQIIVTHHLLFVELSI
jgi:malonyl-CoA O-methyltransferase